MRTRFKLIKPNWACRLLKSGQKNPDFIEEIPGEDSEEGYFDEKYIQAKNKQGFNVYFFPNYPSKMPKEDKYTHGKHIDVLEYVFVDMDLKDKVYKSKEEFYEKLREFNLKPYFVVDSGNGVHAYWRVSDLKKETFCIIQQLLIQHFKTDVSIWTLKQIMRYPGTLNTKKYGNYKKVEIIETVPITNDAYSVNQLFANLPPVTEHIENKARKHVAKAEGRIEDNIVEVDFNDIPEKFEIDYDEDKKIKMLFDHPKSYKGDRSTADMKLCNVLFNKNYSREEALKVLVNTQKARERDADSRMTYAFNIVEKVYKDRPSNYIGSLAETEDGNDLLGFPVNGPGFMDCQENRWETGQVLGLVLGTGVGKTSLTLFILKCILINNPDCRVVFFSLEMPVKAIKKRWKKLTAEYPELMNRIHVVDTKTKDCDIRSIGLQELVWITKDIEKATGDKVIAITIDYMAELSDTIDLRKAPTFNAEGSKIEYSSAKNPIKKLTYETLVSKVKDVAKLTDTFVIMQSQTTKALDRDGDKPLDKHSAFGTASFANMVHWMVTAWQPLIKVYSETQLRVTAWRYCKIREIGENDEIQLMVPNQLAFELKTGDYRPLTKAEGGEFRVMLNQVLDMDKEENEDRGPKYRNSPNISAINLIRKDHDKRNKRR